MTMERSELPWGDDQDVQAGLDVGQDVGLEVGQGPGGGVFQGLAFLAGRGDVVGASPDLDLRVAVLGRRFGLVQPLQVAVVALVQRLVALRRQVARLLPAASRAILDVLMARCKTLV